MSRPIRVIDKRNKHYFVVDDVYLNGYAKHLGPITSMVYISLCRHSSFKDQSAFPSQELISKEIGAGLRSVENAIATLKKWNLIEIIRDRKDRKWARNLYYLLDKEVWVKPSPALGAVKPSPANDDVDHPHLVRTKDTHKKDTHTLSIGKFSKISDIGEKEFEELSNRYHFPISFVRSKYDDMVNWHESTGKTKKNWYATLANWVKRDGMKLKTSDKKRGIDASYL